MSISVRIGKGSRVPASGLGRDPQRARVAPWIPSGTRARWSRPTGWRATFLAGIAGVVWAAPGAVAQEVALPLGTQAPPAALEDLDGHPVQLLDYIEEGKPALLEFWASWCENCEALQPQLDRIQQEWGDEIQVLAVAVAVSQSPRRVKRHLAEHNPGYPYLWDARGEAVRAYAVPGTSVVVILGTDGKVAYTGAGPKQDLVGQVRKILGK